MNEATDTTEQPTTEDKARFVGSTSDQRTVNNTVRHQYRVLSDDEKERMARVKDAGLTLIETLNECCPLGRERSLAITKAEECIMWAVKGLTA